MSELRALTGPPLPPQRAPLHARPAVGERGRFPVLPRIYIPRARLWERLDEATAHSGISLLVAPAGAGKTLGVAGWLLQHRVFREAVWLPSAGDLSLDQLSGVLGRRHNGSPPLVVIDDAHEMDPACAKWLDDRLSQDPEGLRLVLLARWDLPLTRLVPELLGHLTVLRGELLRLDLGETAELVTAHVHGASEELIEAVAAHAQGWCAAVVLIARTVAMSSDPLATAPGVTTNFSAVDRVAREAFAALTPRQRHVLLCLAEEDTVSPTLARHLSNDPTADHVLEDLEDTGLLVSRRMSTAGVLPGHLPTDPFEVAADEQQVTYRVHPLLAEVARRRMRAGGVDVERARSTIRRAVDRDVIRGDLRNCLRRLLAVSDHEGILRLLADHGVSLVLSGDARAVHSFASHHADLVEAEPKCWFVLALERWQSGAHESARSWLHRVTAGDQGVRAEQPSTEALHLACAHLMLALLGDEPLTGAMDYAHQLTEAQIDHGNLRRPDPAVLQLLLGMAELHVGRLKAAGRCLNAVAQDGGPMDLQELRTHALSQLAVSEFLRGREHAVLTLASAAPEKASGAATARSGLTIAAELSRLQIADPEHVRSDARAPDVKVHSGDAVTRFLALLLKSRRFLMHGLAAEAVQTLDAGLEAADPPESLRAPLLVEQALHATLSLDRGRLRTLESELNDAGASGEAAFVAGLRADIADDLPAAVDAFSFAAERASCEQPAVAALASSCRAQLLDAVGRRQEALSDLERAVVVTEVRRSGLPFLGWSRHGTSMTRLLTALVPRRPTEWTEELVRTTAQWPNGITGLAGPVTATPQEQENVAPDGLRLELSPRERDVLNELARGSTYSGIAANLFVSENTVKTHVSSLYAKLGVSRRSEALAVARTLHML